MTIALLSFVMAVPTALARPRVIEMEAAEGKIYKDAARALLEAVKAGDEKGVLAAFVGTGEDLDLINTTLAMNRSLQRFEKLVQARYPGEQEMPGDFATMTLRSIDARTVIVDDEKPNEASISPGTYPFNGFELQKKDGDWKVRSTTVFARDVPHMIEANKGFAAAVDLMITRIDKNEFRSAPEVLEALQNALIPVFTQYEKATRRDQNPTTRGTN